MKIGLIHPFYTFDRDKSNRPFPFGIAYLASYAMQKGHFAEILDLNTTYLNRSQLIQKIKEMGCDLYGISSLSGGYGYVKELAKIIKENTGTVVVIGGPLATHSADIVLQNTLADICVIGQGESTLVEIANNLKNPAAVKGIAYKARDGRMIRNAPAQVIPLDELPWPAYDIMRMEDYIWNSASADMDSRRRFKKGIRIMQMITGRGCPMGCRFCSKIMGRDFMYRSVDGIIEEIKFFIDKYAVNGISFRDELYLINKERAYELASKLKPLKIIWMGQARVDRVDHDLIKYMKECGCTSLGFGIESGSPKMLKAMNKGQTVEQIEQAVKSCNDLDMDMKVQLVMGYPGEDRQTIEETVQLFKRLGHPGRRFHLITPLPGSELYDDLIKRNAIKDQEDYLISLSKREAGFSKGMPLVNLTEFPDEELYKIRVDTEKRMQDNYYRYLSRHPIARMKYLRDKVLYRTDYSKFLRNPLLIAVKLLQKSKLLKNEAEDARARGEKLSAKQMAREYQLWF